MTILEVALLLEALFSSRVRVKLLTHLFRHPEEPFYARRLARETGEHYNAVWRELNNLEQAGLLHSQQNGNLKVYRLNPDFPIYEELARIILKTSGLGEHFRQALADLDAVRWAFIFGSLASGDTDAFSDVDLMLIGEVELLPLSQIVADLEAQLGRDVNYLLLSEGELAQRLAEGDPFLQNVLAGPIVMLVGDEDELRQAVAAAKD